jgi:hypothetical protein
MPSTILPRRQSPGFDPTVRRLSTLPVLSGRDSTGAPTAALSLLACTNFEDAFDFGLHHHEALEILTS